MGVKNLWKLLKPSRFSEPINLNLAIDISSWLYQLNNNNILYNTSLRLINLLYKNTKPFFVLDNQPSFLKRLTLQNRKKAKEKSEKDNFIKNIIYNRVCKKCNKLYRMCEHATVELDEYFDKEYKKVVKIIDEHNYNWGDDYSYEEDSDSELSLTDNQTNQLNGYSHQIITLSTNSMEKEKKLNQLLEERKLRSQKLANSSNIEEFSNQQIQGVKKRNSVLNMINKLENKRIQSDCKKEYFLSKEPNKLREFAYLGSERQNSNDDVNKEIYNDVESEFFSSSDNEVKNFSNEEIKLNNEIKDYLIETNSINYEVKENSESKSDVNDNLFISTIEKCVSTYKKHEMTDSFERNSLPSEVNSTLNFEKKSISNSELNLSATENKSIENLDELVGLPGNVKFVEEINTLYISSLETIKIIIKAFNFPLIQSIGESDVQCAHMNRTGFVDAVISDDNDIFVYGGLKLYRKFFSKQPSFYINNYDQDFLIKMAYFLGSDYNLGVKNVGIKKAQLLIDQVKEEDIRILNEVYKNSPVKDVDDWNFKTSKSSIIKAFRNLGMENKQIEVIKKMLEKCKCDYLTD